MKFRITSLLAVTSALAISTAASAQSATKAADNDKTEITNEDIVVTGTLVRGIAATGASPISVSQASIKETGATNVAQVLDSIPQLGTFNNLQQPRGNSQEVSVNRPNLRNLPGFNTSGGSTTLVLMDGHRLVGMGNASTSPDPDVILPGIIDRIEIIPDGGSAIYGSDAVAGVLNFITIKRFDGVKVDASYGFADNYYRYDGSITAGKDWDSGSLFASYNYAKSDELLGRDRDFVRTFPDPATGLLSLECAPGNVLSADPRGTLASRIYTSNGFTRGSANECDLSDNATIFPSSERHSAFVGLTQQLNDALTFEVRGYYTNRQTRVQNGPFTYNQLTTPLANPAVPGAVSPFAIGPFFTGRLPFAQFVSGQFGASDALRTDISLDTWGITPTLTADLGAGFQLRLLGSYGQSVANFRGTAVNPLALINAIQTGRGSFAPPFGVTGGLFNPYDPSSASPDVLAAITNFQQFGRTRQTFHNERAIIDGGLFSLPAGEVKIAVGLENAYEGFNTQNGVTVPGFQNTGFAGTAIIPAHNAIPRFNVSRTIRSVFGEVVAPLLKTDGGTSLTVSAAGRYDDYSDVGDTFNPRFGATFKPVPWMSIFGAWGTSFNAPSLADDENAGPSSVFVLGGAAAQFFSPPPELVASGRYPAYDGRFIVAERGNAPNIQPQEATTWTLGFDVEPPFIPGLSFGGTYYNIRYNNQIGLAPFETPNLLYQNFPNLITTGPTSAVNAIVANAIANADVLNIQGGSANPSPGSVYAFLDARKRNLGRVQVDGLDFRLNYRKETGFGAIFANANGTYTLNLDRSNTATSAFIDQISLDQNRFSLRSTLGAEVGALQGQITWNHRKGYNLSTLAGFAGTTLSGQTFTTQSAVSDFNTFDLFFKFDVPGEGLAQDLVFTVNVQNVFDTDPPEFRGGDQVLGRRGTANGATLGRFTSIGLSKKF
ncbi:TonB-dependent receptor domain-containing protein [Novosphingobium sp. AAP83]|uniref:TonB-dependent receptor domain-containing protein n=1 Tax=Novosphingobium sp. AAP83 TaxID=1523425 RepID=UPI0009E7BCE7|nr:TonB-dependent receptor [Novosphingobium sp. AAP83]